MVGIDFKREMLDLYRDSKSRMTDGLRAESRMIGDVRFHEHRQIDASIADDFGRSAATVAYECWNDLADRVVEKLNPHCYPWLYETPEDGVAP